VLNIRLDIVQNLFKLKNSEVVFKVQLQDSQQNFLQRILSLFSQKKDQFLSEQRVVPNKVILNRVSENRVRVGKIERSNRGKELQVDKNI
jgi:hypothetical protein